MSSNRNSIIDAVQDTEDALEEQQVKPVLTLVPSKITDGRDELNFAEFPLATLSEKQLDGVKTLHFEDRIFDKSKRADIVRKLTISGSDACGLPTPMDEEVLLALLQLSKLQGFGSRKVYFSRHQLLQILKWSPSGQNYDRLRLAFDRLSGVIYFYKNSWRDKEDQKWQDRNFHIIDNVEINSEERGHLSYILWNETVFKSLTKGNVKALDFDFFIKLNSAITKRLYRFIDKRFYHCETQSLDLKNLCYEHIGLSRNSPIAELKRKLNKAIDELVSLDYLAPLSAEERYQKKSKGNWEVLFVKYQAGANKQVEVVQSDDIIETKLLELGVRANKVKQLLEHYSRELIAEKLKMIEWLKGKKDKSVLANPAGYIVSAIEKDYKPSKSFDVEGRAQVQKRQQEVNTLQQAQKRSNLDKADQVREDSTRILVQTYLKSLTEAEVKELEETALQNAGIAKLKLMAKGGRAAVVLREQIIRDHVLKILNDEK